MVDWNLALTIAAGIVIVPFALYALAVLLVFWRVTLPAAVLLLLAFAVHRGAEIPGDSLSFSIIVFCFSILIALGAAILAGWIKSNSGSGGITG